MGAILSEPLKPGLSSRERAMVLIANDPLKKADVAVLLEGDGYHRVVEAARLYREGWVREVLFSGGVHSIPEGKYPHEMVVPELITHGVPESAIIVEDTSLHTLEQARNVIGMATARGWQRMLLVASHYHQYRAYLTFLKALLDANSAIELINAPARQPDWFSETGWGVRYELLEIEFQKLEAFCAAGHVATFEAAIEYQRWKADRI